MADAHTNFAYSLVATAPSPATSGTSLVVTAGQGTLFPAVPFNATIWPTASQPLTTNAEIVRVTNISTDTLTITRTQESTSARTVVVGDQIAATVTAKTLTDVEATVATDTIWDAAGDVVIGTGADAAARLAIGTAAGKALVADPNATDKASINFPQGVFEALGGTTGCLAATMDRADVDAVASGAATSGTLRLMRILLPKGLPVTNIKCWSGTTGGASLTNQWFGLFDSSRVVLAKTADDTSTAWAASTAKSLAITAGPFVTTYAGWHYVGILVAASTVPTIECKTIATSPACRSAAPIVGGNSTVGLTTPASCTGTQTAITVLSQLAYIEIL